MLGPGAPEGQGDAPKIVVHGVEGEALDKYTAGIELSNRCREFYVCRLKAVETYRQRLGLKLTLPDLGSNPAINLGSNPNLTLGSNPTLNFPNHCVTNTMPGKLGSNPSHHPRGSPRPASTHLSGYRPPPQGQDSPRAPASPLRAPASPLRAPATSPREPASSPGIQPRRRTSIDKSMEVLKREMASLIDQDLVLMKQLLTLNEQIEELKWQRKLYGYSRGSLTASSCQLDSSACTLSEGDLLDTNPSELPQKYPTPSSLSLYKELHTHPEAEEGEGAFSRDGEREEKKDSTSDIGSSGELTNSVNELLKHTKTNCVRDKDSNQVPSGQQPYKSAHGEQQSFDSGIHDPDHPMADILL